MSLLLAVALACFGGLAGLPAVVGSQPPDLRAGMVDGDLDPEHTPLDFASTAVRPALDYQNRSFGLDLGRPTRVRSLTVINDLPRTGCRIDAAHTELYYGDRNGEFTRYPGPMLFRKGLRGEAVLIHLEGLDFTARFVKVRFAYPDGDYTAIAGSVGGAVAVNENEPQAKDGLVRLWTWLQGEPRRVAWQPAWGWWEGAGAELRPVETPLSDRYSGEGGRIFLSREIAGDFTLSLEFLMPANTDGAGGPVVYFDGAPDGSLSAFRFVNYWGTSVLQRRAAGQPWAEFGYRTGRDLEVDKWHRLALTRRGGKVTVAADGKRLVVGRDRTDGWGTVGLGCQVRQVRYRNVSLRADRMRPGGGWASGGETPAYSVVCADAGRGGYQAFPGLCRLRNGDLLCVFYGGWGHVSRPGERFPSGGAVAVCRSTDLGRTWGPPAVVLDTPLDDRDPAVWQCDDGTVMVSSATVDWPRFRPPYTGWARAFTVRSTDDGRTWTSPEELVVGADRRYVIWTEPRRLANGDWLLPMYRYDGATCAGVMRSTDGGRTWGPPVWPDPEARGTDEPDLCQFPDGSLLCVMRPVSEPHMWQSRSNDGGATWTRPSPLPFHGHCSNLLHTRAGVTLLGRRDPGTTIAYSLDNGHTWAGPAMIDPCGGAYTQMVELPDGRVLVVYYTEGSQSQIRAQVLTVGPEGITATAP